MKNTSGFVPHLFSFLAEQFHHDDFFAYEAPKESFFTLGRDKTVKIYSGKVELIDKAGNISVVSRKESPSRELAHYFRYFLLNDKIRRVFGWVTFEFSVEEFGVTTQSDDILLAVFFVPSVEIRFVEENIEIYGHQDFGKEILNKIEDHLDKISFEPFQVQRHNKVNFTKESSYQNRVSIAVSEIKSGKYDKVILSRKVFVPFEVNFPQSYLNGRLANTPARSFLFQQDGFSSFGFSPELVVRVESDGKIITEPLAGTRAYYADNKEKNLELKKILYTDPKEVFEHAISVKTSCEEIGQISQNNKAYISEFMEIKHRGVVQHLGSTVIGQLDKNKDVFHALSALFPSVTASGLPKKEAIEAITRLDDAPRGLYSGGLGYYDIEGTFEMTLVLRSLFQEEGKTFIRVGAGIISYSDPERELEETCEKISSIAPFLVGI